MMQRKEFFKATFRPVDSEFLTPQERNVFLKGHTNMGEMSQWRNSHQVYAKKSGQSPSKRASKLPKQALKIPHISQRKRDETHLKTDIAVTIFLFPTQGREKCLTVPSDTYDQGMHFHKWRDSRDTFSRDHQDTRKINFSIRGGRYLKIQFLSRGPRGRSVRELHFAWFFFSELVTLHTKLEVWHEIQSGKQPRFSGEGGRKNEEISLQCVDVL